MIQDNGMLCEAYAYFDKKEPVLFFILSAEGRIIDENRHAETMMG